jgi:cystathionine beta-lyase/cystathionine gamma-synthase
MSGAGGLLTFVLKTCTLYQIESFCNQLQHILIAVSWGGHESLIIPRCASISSTEFDPANQEHLMLRLYVGLESANYIISDIDQAFRKSGLL